VRNRVLDISYRVSKSWHFAELVTQFDFQIAHILYTVTTPPLSTHVHVEVETQYQFSLTTFMLLCSILLRSSQTISLLTVCCHFLCPPDVSIAKNTLPLLHRTLILAGSLRSAMFLMICCSPTFPIVLKNTNMP